MINKYYFINKLETNSIYKQDNQTAIIYRNYNSKTVDEKLILKIKQHCKRRKIKFYLSNNVKLAIKLDLDGVYIPHLINLQITWLFHSKKFNIIGSAHNIKEIRIKEIQNVNGIFISSVFKKNKNYLGINKFKLISKLTKKKVVALGGISRKI